MSDVIDWSKAPEGATHFAPRFGSFNALWARVNNGKYEYYHERNCDWYSGAQPQKEEKFIARPQPTQWSGEVLPPVGEVCDMQDDNGAWIKVEIIANHAGFAHGWDSVHECAYFSPHVCEFRPIRTHEQIAADERQYACEEMLSVTMSRRSDPDVFEAISTLYDAGYRKP